MRIKLDENLPARLLSVLRRHGYDVDTVAEEHLTGHPDAKIWETARKENRFLITQDLNFPTPADSLPEPVPGRFWSGCVNPVRMPCWKPSARLPEKSPVGPAVSWF